MGLFGFIKKQFVDVIEWVETEEGILSLRYPMRDQEIQNGAKLTVRESQEALFVNEGKIADLFQPGLYTLTTQTLPVMTNLQNWDKFFASPFKSDVYYFSTRLQTDQKWGTPTPITFRDKELGPIRLRAYGIYAYQVSDPKTFYLKISGSRDVYRREDLEGQLRATVITHVADHFGGGEVHFLDMARNQLEFSEILKKSVAPGFNNLGLELSDFKVESLSLPEALQARFDELASMNMIGDLKRYAQFQTAASIPVAAANEGGIAGAGAGVGVGLSMAQTIGQSLGVGSSPSKEGTEDPLITIEKLHQLSQKGIISSQEFELKKAELLKKIG